MTEVDQDTSLTVGVADVVGLYRPDQAATASRHTNTRHSDGTIWVGDD